MTPSTSPPPTAPAATPALSIAGEFNIFTAQQTKALLLDAIAAAPDGGDSEILIELSQVTELDCAGLQLMFMARSEAHRQGKRLHFVQCSESVANVVTLCDMADSLGLSAFSSPQP